MLTTRATLCLRTASLSSGTSVQVPVDCSKAMAWAFRPDCPKCGKGKMGKPIKDNGKVDKKATHYECQQCKHTMDEEEMAPLMKVNVAYTCHYCSHKGEAQVDYKRKSFKGVQAFVFECGKCGKKMPISKKLKDVEELL